MSNRPHYKLSSHTHTHTHTHTYIHAHIRIRVRTHIHVYQFWIHKQIVQDEKKNSPRWNPRPALNPSFDLIFYHGGQSRQQKEKKSHSHSQTETNKNTHTYTHTKERERERQTDSDRVRERRTCERGRRPLKEPSKSPSFVRHILVCIPAAPSDGLTILC